MGVSSNQAVYLSKNLLEPAHRGLPTWKGSTKICRGRKTGFSLREITMVRVEN